MPVMPSELVFAPPMTSEVLIISLAVCIATAPLPALMPTPLLTRTSLLLAAFCTPTDAPRPFWPASFVKISGINCHLPASRAFCSVTDAASATSAPAVSLLCAPIFTLALFARFCTPTVPVIIVVISGLLMSGLSVEAETYIFA